MQPYMLAVGIFRSVIIGTPEILLLLQQRNLSLPFYYIFLHHYFNRVIIRMP
jgi:hypothetical protein